MCKNVRMSVHFNSTVQLPALLPFNNDFQSLPKCFHFYEYLKLENLMFTLLYMNNQSQWFHLYVTHFNN